MRRFIQSSSICFSLFLASCYASVDPPVQLENSYSVSAYHTALGSGLSSHSEIRQLAIKRGQKFCAHRKQEFRMISFFGTGNPGWGSIDETVNFRCIPKMVSSHLLNPAKGNLNVLTLRLLSDKWLSSFIGAEHRYPVLEFVNIEDESAEIYLYGVDQKQIIKGAQEIVVNDLIRSNKVHIVTIRSRTLTQFERYFQMKHATSDSISEPGHVRGADFVLVYRHSALPVSSFQGDPQHLVGKIFFRFQLIRIKSNEIVWTGEEEMDYDSFLGETATITSSNPDLKPSHLIFENGKWFAVK